MNAKFPPISKQRRFSSLRAPRLQKRKEKQLPDTALILQYPPGLLDFSGCVREDRTSLNFVGGDSVDFAGLRDRFLGKALLDILIVWLTPSAFPTNISAQLQGDLSKLSIVLLARTRAHRDSCGRNSDCFQMPEGMRFENRILSLWIDKNRAVVVESFLLLQKNKDKITERF